MNIAQFESNFGTPPRIHASAPGRVNLIGEHTDYNDGFVMPVAIQYRAEIFASPRDDQEIHLVSADFDGHVSFILGGKIPFDKKNRWSNYERGVIDQYIRRRESLKGANLLIRGNVPIGAGLSSSAAIEMATAAALKALNSIDISMVDMIRLCQAAENQFVGMKCGIMDQFISGMGRAGMALLLDCRSLGFEQVPFPADKYSVMIMNTKVKRELTGTEYNERRSQCEEGVRLLQGKLPGIKALRDVTIEDFQKNRSILPGLVQKRCSHVIHENARVKQFADALIQQNAMSFGKLMLESHNDLRDLYEVSCPELNLMVELAMRVSDVAGARMTGAGFGGCVIAIVEKGREQAVSDMVFSEYPSKTGIEPEVYISQPSEGVSVKEL
jgi:galactokinase